MIRPPPRPPLFPYTTLFRSPPQAQHRQPDRRPRGRGARPPRPRPAAARPPRRHRTRRASDQALDQRRSEEHTSELQSLTNLVCRLLLEKKKKKRTKKHRERN